jgi:hypothetical protein
MSTLPADFLIEPSEKAQHIRAKHICKACCGSGYDWGKEIGVVPDEVYDKLMEAEKLYSEHHKRPDMNTPYSPWNEDRHRIINWACEIIKGQEVQFLLGDMWHRLANLESPVEKSDRAVIISQSTANTLLKK